jgi:hypothetical protein
MYCGRVHGYVPEDARAHDRVLIVLTPWLLACGIVSDCDSRIGRLECNKGAGPSRTASDDAVWRAVGMYIDSYASVKRKA